MSFPFFFLTPHAYPTFPFPFLHPNAIEREMIVSIFLSSFPSKPLLSPNIAFT